MGLKTMNQSDLIPATQTSNIYRLEGKVLRRWWQTSAFFSSPFRRKKAEPDKYENPAIKSQLAFVLQLPFGIGLMLYLAGPPGIKMALMGGAVGVLMLVQLFFTFKHHCKYIVEVQEQDSGLVLKSPQVNRTVRWSEIVDFFAIQNGDYLLQCTNGDDFILSEDLTNSKKLFDRILAIKPKTSEQYSYSYRLPNAFLDGPAIASFALIIAFSFPIIRWVVQTGKVTEIPLTEAIAAAITISLVVAHWRISQTKVAELIRFGKHSILTRARIGKTSTVQLDEIRSIKRFLGFHTIKTRHGWFLFLADKKEPASAKLLELKQHIQLIK